MAKRKEARVSFGLSELADTFQLKINLLGQCAELDNWLNTTSTFTEAETLFLEDLYLDVQADGNYWNEEELKIEMLNILRGNQTFLIYLPLYAFTNLRKICNLPKIDRQLMP